MKIEILKPSEIPESWYNQVLGLDIETESDDTFSRITTIQVYNHQEKRTIIIPVHAVWKGELTELPESEVEILKKFLATIKAVGHNLQFDLAILLHTYGVEIEPKFDTFLMARVLQLEEQALKPLILRLHPEYRELICEWKDLGFSSAPWVFDLDDPRQVTYAGLDPYLPFILGSDFKERILKNKPAIDLENQYLRVAVRVHASGLNVDEEVYQRSLDSVSQEYEEKQKELNEMAGFPVRPNSSRDLKVFLIESMGIAPTRLTPKGEPAFNQDSINMMADNVSSDLQKSKAVSLVQEVKSLRSVLGSLEKVPTYFL